MTEIIENDNNNETTSEDIYFKNLDVSKCRDVHIIKYHDTKIYVVGTAHVSRESKRLVKKVIEDIKPSLLCVELDHQRYSAITGKKKWEDLNIFEIIKAKKTFFLITQLALAGFQRKIGNQMGVKPGAEMLEAINIAESNNIPIELVDREVAITLKRASGKTPFFKKMVLLSNIVAGFFSKQEINEEELNNLRKSDVVTELMKDLQKHLPEAKEVLVDERDQYLVAKTIAALNKNEIKTSDKQEIVLVVGAGHVMGIKKSLEENIDAKIDINCLNKIPPQSFYSKIIPWMIPVLIFIAFAYGFFTQDYSAIKKGVIFWILSNGILSSIGSAVALAHPFSILISFFAAPITSLNPTIGAGFIVGLAEAFFRKPRVIDFNNLTDDISSLKGWYRNRLTRILLVFIGSSIGSAIGTWVAISWFLTS